MTWYFWTLIIIGYIILSIIFQAFIKALDINHRVRTNKPVIWGFLWPLWLVGNIFYQFVFVIILVIFSGLIPFNDFLEEKFIKWTKPKR